MVKPQTSNILMTYEYIWVTYEWIRMTYEYIRVAYGWHTSIYEWHTDDIRVHTSDIRMTYEYIRVTYGWHAVRKKNISFLIIFFPNIWFVKEFPAWDVCFWLFTKIKKGSRISVWWIFSAWFFHANALYLILNIISMSYLFSFSRY